MSRRGTFVLYWSLGFFFIAGICFLTAWSVGGWGALLPALAGIAFGLIAIVLGLIGLVMKLIFLSKRPAKSGAEPKPQASPEARRRGIIVGISIPIILGILGYFTFITPIDKLQHNKETLTAWSKSLPAGVTMDLGNVELIRPCFHFGNADNCSSAIYAWVQFTTSPNPADYCRTLIAWAKSKGANFFGFDDAQIDLAKYPTYAQYSCVSGNGLLLYGQDGKTPWFIQLSPNDKTSYIYYDGGARNHNEVTPDSQFTDDPSFYALEAIGKWRKDHPDEKETNKSLEAAVKSLTNYKEFQQAKVILGGVDKLHYMTFPSPSDATQTYCIVVEPYDEKFFGIPDPGYGYYPRWWVNELDSYGQFGDSSTDTCLNQGKQD